MGNGKPLMISEYKVYTMMSSVIKRNFEAACREAMGKNYGGRKPLSEHPR